MNVNEEIGNKETPEAEQAKQDDQLPKAVIVDGRSYTEKEIRELEVAHDNYDKDYRQKTQQLAGEKRAFGEEKARLTQEITQEKEQLRRLVAALDEDQRFFQTETDPEKWATYEPKVNPIARELGLIGGSGGGPELKELLNTVKELNKKVDSLSTVNTRLAAERVVDDTIKSIGESTKTYPLADKGRLEEKIRLYQYENNGNLPSQAWIASAARTEHDRMSALGLKPPAREDPTKKKETLKPSGKTPDDKAPKPPNLDNPQETRQAFRAYLDRKKAASGG